MTSCCPLEVEAVPIAPEDDDPDADEPPTLIGVSIYIYIHALLSHWS